jgi:hypothetical protein
MKSALDMGGLKCDNPSCDYKNPNIHLSEYADYVGATCPQCGEVLLTQADFDAVQKLVEFAEIIGLVEDDVPMARLEMDGSGSITIKL